MSKEIDYAFIGGLKGLRPELFSEVMLLGQPSVNFDLHPDLPDPLPELLPPSSRLVRVAVNSKVMKLSYRLFNICKRIQKESETPVQFYFFPGEMGFWFDGIRAAIKAQLPDAEVVAYQGYAEFIKKLAQCDLALAAFPFGNTNSTVDTCLLGLPTVVHFGPEPPAQTDSLVIETAGLSSALVCDDDETFYATAMKLINDPSEIANAMGGSSRAEIRERLANPVGQDSDSDFADMLWYVYNNDQKLRENGSTHINIQDISNSVS